MKRNVIILGASIILLVITVGIYFYTVSGNDFEKAKVDIQNGNFSQFSNLVYFDTNMSESKVNEIINQLREPSISGNYTDRMFYDVLGELRFISTTPDVNCIKRMKTPRCIFYNAVLTDNENLCNLFPEQKEESVTGKYGVFPAIMYYKDSCILYSKVYKVYLDSDNKTQFCSSFSEDYIKEACDFYTLTPQRDFSSLY